MSIAITQTIQAFSECWGTKVCTTQN